jgi:NADH-quinone oxidoreductase subunit N
VTWSDLYALLPILILALGAAFVLLLGAWRPSRRPLLLLGTALALAAALAAGLAVPPHLEVARMFGTGGYGRFFAVLWSAVAALTLLLSLRYGEERRFAGGEYTALVLFAAVGMSLLSAATSLVGLFLGLESFTLALYILIAFHKDGAEGAEAGLKYLVMGAVATGFLAFGIALIYTAAGSFHLPEAMTALVVEGRLRPLALLGWAMLLVAIGFKTSLVPFHLWTPDVYQGAPAPVTGLLATGSKGAVFAALIPLLSALDAGRSDLAPLLWMLAAVTMLAGTLCALRQENLKRMLAYSSVVHMGYLLTGLLAGGVRGNSAVIFYLVAYSAASLGAFAILTSFSDTEGEPRELSDLRGLGYRHPWRAGALGVFLLSLAGIPPTAGFIGKFGIFHAALRADYLALALIGVLASVVSLYYYLRPLIALFMADDRARSRHGGEAAEHAAILVCFAAALALGVFPGPLLELIAAILP